MWKKNSLDGKNLKFKFVLEVHCLPEAFSNMQWWLCLMQYQNYELFGCLFIRSSFVVNLREHLFEWKVYTSDKNQPKICIVQTLAIVCSCASYIRTECVMTYDITTSIVNWRINNDFNRMCHMKLPSKREWNKLWTSERESSSLEHRNTNNM